MPKLRKGLLLAVLSVLLVLSWSSTAMAASHGKQRQLSAAAVQLHKLQRQEWKSKSVINFWNNRGRWALHLRHDKCWQLKGKSQRKVCAKARKSLRNHQVRLVRVQKRIFMLQPWQNDVRRTYNYRQCIINHESRMAPPIYKAENGGTRWSEGPGFSDASGAYQFLDGTWTSMTRLAEAYYGVEISNTGHAADAPSWAQDAVAAFASVRYGASDWTWNC
jgi:hypothetical protein